MAFNEATFRADAKEAGYSDQEIEDQLKKESKPPEHSTTGKLWDMANEPMAQTGLSPLQTLGAGAAGAAGVGAAYQGGKAAINSMMPESHGDREARLKADIAEHDLEVKKWEFEQKKTKLASPEKQITPTPEVPVTPEVPKQQNITLAERSAMKPPVKPPVPEVAPIPEVPATPTTVSPEVKALAPVVSDNTLAMAEVATGKPAVPNAVAPPARNEFLQKVKDIQSQAVIPPGAGARRTADQMKVLKAEMPLNNGVNQIATEVGTFQPSFPKVPEAEHRTFMQDAIEKVYGGTPPTSQGGSVKQNKQLDNWIESNANKYPNVYANYQQLKAMHGTQGGGVSLGMLGLLAGNSLGAAQIMKQLKDEDYSGAGVNAFTQLLGNIAPKLGLGSALMAPNTVESGLLYPRKRMNPGRGKVNPEFAVPPP